MKAAHEFWIDKYGQYPDTVSGKITIEMMDEYGKYVREQLEPLQSPQPHTFPTEKEFSDWYGLHNQGGIAPSEYYHFFRDRVQPLEIGRVYDFCGESGDSIRGTFKGYSGPYGAFTHIRPIQNPNQDLIERLKAIQDDTGAVADAIKALEDKK